MSRSTITAKDMAPLISRGIEGLHGPGGRPIIVKQMAIDGTYTSATPDKVIDPNKFHTDNMTSPDGSWRLRIPVDSSQEWLTGLNPNDGVSSAPGAIMGALTTYAARDLRKPNQDGKHLIPKGNSGVPLSEQKRSAQEALLQGVQIGLKVPDGELTVVDWEEPLMEYAKPNTEQRASLTLYGHEIIKRVVAITRSLREV